MGTETHRCTITHSMRIYERVKLNNPLMGDGNYSAYSAVSEFR